MAFRNLTSVGRGSRRSSSRTSRSPPARSASRRSPTGQVVPVHDHHAGPADRRRAVRRHDPQDRRRRAASSGCSDVARDRAGRPGLRPGLHARRQARRSPSRSTSGPAPTPWRPPSLVRDKMEELKERFPEGVDYAIVYDTTPFITESVNEVFKTLRDAVILVAVVVLLFLQNWRSALIPLIAVPVADRRHLRRHGRAGLLAQQPDAVRPGAGDRHRGRRRDRGGRGGRAPHRGRPGAGTPPRRSTATPRPGVSSGRPSR